MKRYKIDERDLNCKKSVNLILDEKISQGSIAGSSLLMTDQVIKKRKTLRKDEKFKNIATLNGKLKGWYQNTEKISFKNLDFDEINQLDVLKEF